MRTILFLSLVFAANHSVAAVHCVGTATGFRAALTAAATNGEPDDIRLQPGNYYGYSAAPFHITLAAGEPHGIRISGGWSATSWSPCAFTSGNASLTTLDGMNSSTALSIRVNVAHTVVPITVEGLTLRRGTNSSGNEAAGLSIRGMADAAPQINVDRVIVEDNAAAGVGYAVLLASDTHFIRFSNSIVRFNETENGAAVAILSNNGASSLHNLTVLFNARSTPGSPVHWIGSAPGQMTESLLWGNTGGADLGVYGSVRYKGNRYGSVDGSFTSGSFNNFVVSGPQLDNLHRPLTTSPLRDLAWGVGAKDVYGNNRRINGWADVGAAEGVLP